MRSFILFFILLCTQVEANVDNQKKCSMKTKGINGTGITTSWHYTSDACPFLQECWKEDPDSLFGYNLFADSKLCTEPNGVNCYNTTGGCQCSGICFNWWLWIVLFTSVILVLVCAIGYGVVQACRRRTYSLLPPS